jgi:hypothetical protein
MTDSPFPIQSTAPSGVPTDAQVASEAPTQPPTAARPLPWHENGTSWSNPDRGLLSNGSGPAPKLPFGTFGGFGGCLEGIARSAGAPVDYVAFTMMTCAAALMGNARKVMPDPEGSEWAEPLALWTILVGPPSSNKTPAMKPFVSLLEKIEKHDAEQYAPTIAAREAKREAAKASLASWKSAVIAAQKDGKPIPPRPDDAIVPPKAVAPRTYTNSATIEALIELLSNNDNGLLLMRDELAGWVGDMTKYSNSSDRPHWLSMYSGQSITVDRIKYEGEPLHVENALMSVVGGMQPDRLKEGLNTADDGFMARFLFICADAVELVRSVGKPDVATLIRIFDRLRALRSTQVTMTFDAEAADEFFEFQKYTRKSSSDASGIMQGWIGKGNGVVARIAAILTLLDWAHSEVAFPPHVVEKREVERACELWAQYLLPMARRALGDASRPQIEKNAVTLLKEIRRRGKPDLGTIRLVNSRVIYREWKLEGLREAKDVHAALSYLMEAGWVHSNFEKRDDGKFGRPLNDWTVNPLLWHPVP